mmetsp:Transcript_58035/g.147437  ORF Transcript_58035/g.147437 Transcript_58035/m.147437 type:complete len:503 (-) Transcript_58035:131-1639(-)
MRMQHQQQQQQQPRHQHRSQPPLSVQQTREQLCQQSRDLSGLVRQVNAILPQFSTDVVCEALIQKDEDVPSTVEYLLSSSFETKAGKKKTKKQHSPSQTVSALSIAEPKQEESCVAVEHGDTLGDDDDPGGALQDNYVGLEERQERSPTMAEKQVLKIKKKLREIERIEEKLARKEKVDKMQLPKLERRPELEHELRKAEEVVQEEERQREHDREQTRLETEMGHQRLLAETEARAAAEIAAAAEAAAETQRQRLLVEEQHKRLQEDHRRQDILLQNHQLLHEQPEHLRHTPANAVFRSQDVKGMEILSMLHKAPQAGNYQQAKQLAHDLGGGGRLLIQSFHGVTSTRQMTAQLAAQRPFEDSQAHVQPLLQAQWNGNQQGGTSQSWDEQTTWPEQAEELSFMNEYSTPLDVTSIPIEKRKLAEQIAKEIEGPGSADGKVGGCWQQRGRGNPSGKGSLGGQADQGHRNYGGFSEKKSIGGKGDSKGKGKYKHKNEAGVARRL